MDDYWDRKQKAMEGKKETLSLAAELFVAGEMLRRDWPASITYGADRIFSVSVASHPIDIRVAKDEKFSTEGLQTNIVVFVNLPRLMSNPPEFYILTISDIDVARRKRQEAQKPMHNMPWSKKNQKPIVARLTDILLDELRPYLGNWFKIADIYSLPKILE